MPASRLEYLDWLLRQEGKPCLWDCKGTWTDSLGHTAEAWDCSGLVTDGLHHAGGPDLRAEYNTAVLWERWEPVMEGGQRPGDLLLYGTLLDVAGRTHLIGGHVMTWWGDGRVYGACGATHRIATLDDARKAGARIRFHSRRDYRGDFRGFRRLPAE